MENLLPGIRNATRALIVRDGNILLLRKDGYDSGERFALPGGAQEPGETLVQALDRECREEIGAEVRVGDLVYVADWFKSRETEPPTTRQLVEFLFECSIPEDYEPQNGYRPDKHQAEVVWMPLHRVPEIRLLPPELARHLGNPPAAGAVYLGAMGQR